MPILNPKSRADIAGKLTDDEKCSMVSVSVSSLQVAVIIHVNYCIIPTSRDGFKMWQEEVSFSFSNSSKNELFLSSRVNLSVSQNAAI